MGPQSEDELRERQEDEVAVLKAMYEADFEDLRLKDVWKVRRPPEFTLRLEPNFDSRGLGRPTVCSAVLHIKCSDRYPLSPPDLIEVLSESPSLEMAELLRLQGSLQELAVKLTGEVMAAELAQNVSEWLALRNKMALETAAASKKTSFVSFHDEMEARHKANLEELASKRRNEPDKTQLTVEERAAILEEITETAEALKEEKQRLRDQQKQASPSKESFAGGGKNGHGDVKAATGRYSRVKSIHLSECGSESSVEAGDRSQDGVLAADEPWQGVQTVNYIVKGECVKVEKTSRIGRKNLLDGSVVHLGVISNSGKLVAVGEWNFRTGSGGVVASGDQPSQFPRYDESALIRQLSSLEQEVASVQKVGPHPNVVRCLGLSWEKTGGLHRSTDPAGVRVRVFEEFVLGTNMSFHLNEGVPMDCWSLRHCSQGALEALNYMHGNNVVHRDLRDTSIFFDARGTIKVSDFSINKRLRDIVRSGHLPPSWEENRGFDRFPPGLGRGGKKADIYRLGVLLLSLAVGDSVQDPSNIPKNLPTDLVDFLKKCLTRDERDRWSAQELLLHSWIVTSSSSLERWSSPLRSGMQRTGSSDSEDGVHSLEAKDRRRPRRRGSSAAAAAAAANDHRGEDDDDDAKSQQLSSSKSGSNPDDHRQTAIPFAFLGSGSVQSRLQSEFSFIGDIGKGGFGDVFKVKNKLDSQVYAIKRIKLDPKDRQTTKKIMREVKLLSRLNHEHVVRYYNSWIEVMECSEPEAVSASSSEDDDDDDEGDMETNVGDSPPSSATHFSGKGRILAAATVHRNEAKAVVKFPSGSGKKNAAEWSCCFTPFVAYGEKNGDDRESSTTSNEDEDDIFGTSFLPKVTGDSIWDDDSSSDGGAKVDDDSESSEGRPPSKAAGRPRTNQDEADDAEDSLIVFEQDSADTGHAEEASLAMIMPAVKPAAAAAAAKISSLQHMYIQMEYCDKQTLRTAIDEESLFSSTERMWRMFREIIEGLVHIHTQGMIHRDLKPVNIFIDFHDHVKIGDFGLATTNMILHHTTTMPLSGSGGGKRVQSQQSFGGTDSLNDTMENTADMMTGQIGTVMYVAPEINSAARIAVAYNQKVDIYSLGVIFFEMCRPPLTTGMERIKVLTDLRSKDIVMPPGDEYLTPQQIHIARWLLDHDPRKRPTSLELLKSDFLPPPQVEQVKLQETIRHALANAKSKAYRYLIDSCMSQPVSHSQDIKYDMDVSKGNAAHQKSLLTGAFVREAAERVFRKHGALHFQSPQLMPKGRLRMYDKAENLVQVMTRSGGVVTLPFDLRVSFARFIARTGIGRLRRYCISPIYRESRVYGVQPKPLVECAFDIVGPLESRSSLVADAEVMVVAEEVLRQFRSFDSVNFFFRVNHSTLLNGILLHFGVVGEEDRQRVNEVIREGGDRQSSKEKRAFSLVDMGLSEHVASNLLDTLEREGTVAQQSGFLRQAMRRKNQASSFIKQGLHELEVIESHCRAMGLKSNLIVSPSLVHHPERFQGMVCQLVYRKRIRGHKDKKGPTTRGTGGGRPPSSSSVVALHHHHHEVVVAAGGRYDHLIHSFADKFSIVADDSLKATNMVLEGGPDDVEPVVVVTEDDEAGAPPPGGVGISLLLEKLVPMIGQDEVASGFAVVDAIVAAASCQGSQLSTMPLFKLSVAKELRAHGVNCLVHDDDDDDDEGAADSRCCLEEAQEMAKHCGALFVVVVEEPPGGDGRGGGGTHGNVRLLCPNGKEVHRFASADRNRMMTVPEMLDLVVQGRDRRRRQLHLRGSDASPDAMGQAAPASISIASATSSSGSTASIHSSSAAAAAPFEPPEAQQRPYSGNSIGGGVVTGGWAPHPGSGLHLNLRFLTTERFDGKKFPLSSKRRVEAAINAKVGGALAGSLANGVVVEVLILPLPGAIIKQIASYLDFEDEPHYASSSREIVEKNSRYKKELHLICDEIHGLKFGGKRCPCLVLYSLEDGVFRVVMP